MADDGEDEVFQGLEVKKIRDDEDKQQHEDCETTPPRKEDENQKLKDEDICKLSLDNNTSLLAQQSEHLTLQQSCKKRWRDRDTREEEETPSKRRKQEEDKVFLEDYHSRRGRLLTDMFGEVGNWCEECAMQPCICVLNRIELRLVEEKIRRVSSQKTTTPTRNSPQDTKIVSPTTTGDPATPTTTTTSADVGGSGKKVARVLKPWGLDCRKEDRVYVSPAGLSSITRRKTEGSPTTTTTPKRLGARKKVQSNNRKKVIKMTNDEKGRMMQSNKDIRGYFGAKTTPETTKEEENMLSGAPSFKTLLRAAEERSTMGKKVSEYLSKPNSVCSRKLDEGRRMYEDAKPSMTPSMQDTPSMKGMRSMDGMLGMQRAPSLMTGPPDSIEMGGVQKMMNEKVSKVPVVKYGPSMPSMRSMPSKNPGPGVCGDDGGAGRVLPRLPGILRDSERGAAGNDVLGSSNSVYLQKYAGTGSPGPHPDRRGAAGGDGSGVVGDGGGRGCSKQSSSLKTKPNEVGGGLMAKVLLWEMKTKGVVDENCTADSSRHSFNNADRKQKDRVGTQHGQDRS